MIPNQSRCERGQTLVIVALMMGVLMLMAGLAVDVGMAYNERRDLQNAADAAALAGAQQLCDNRGEPAASAAAVDMGQANGAITVTNQITMAQDARRIAVTVQGPSPTFFFRLLGIRSVPVSARAAAECSCAAAVAGAWPIAFDIDQWNRMSCVDPETGAIRPGLTGSLSPLFLAWEDSNKDVWVDDLCAPNRPNNLNPCDCTPFREIFEATGITTVSSWGGNPNRPGGRGWVQLSSPPDVGPPWDGRTCTGAMTLRTWMEFGYPGTIERGKCVATQTGNIASALQAARDGGIRDSAVLLFEPNPAIPCIDGETIGGCKVTGTDGSTLRIADPPAGCIRVQRIYVGPNRDKLSVYQLGTGRPTACQVPSTKETSGTLGINNDVGILALKMCTCALTGGGQAGGNFVTTCVPAVSLVQ